MELTEVVVRSCATFNVLWRTIEVHSTGLTRHLLSQIGTISDSNTAHRLTSKADLCLYKPIPFILFNVLIELSIKMLYMNDALLIQYTC